MNYDYNKYKYFLENSITNQYGGTTDINQEWYNMDVHYGMLRDYNRMTCYYKFIRQNKWLKNKICCDIGSGTGILSLFALLAGVKHIYIIENQKNMIETIKILMNKHNIPNNRYTIYQGWSTNVTLPEKVDCIIHELIGMWGNAEQCLGYVAEFRDRHLKQNGKIIPDIVEVNLTLQHTNHFYDPMYGSKFDYMDHEINLDFLFNNDYEYELAQKKYSNNILSITDNDYNYVENTSDCNTEKITYNLLKDSLESINTKQKKIQFIPKSKQIIALLSTITYYCSDIKGIFGDSGKYNTNWRKQLILFKPIKINLGDIITCIIRMKNLKNSTIEQQINIKLYKNNNKFYSNKFRSLYDNKWLYNFDPVGLYFPNNALSKMKEMTNN